MTTAVLEVEDLSVAVRTPASEVPVLERLSFRVGAGRTLALVGESGCGKSMTALAVMGLLPDGFRRTGGRVLLNGEDLAAAPPSRLRALRGNSMSMIFQEPMTALNPVYTVGDQITEVLRLHQGMSRRHAIIRAIEILRAVQIPAPETRVNAYPHQLSGGMRQRVMIAMALACRPKLLIADEPTTALDVTVQAQVFDLLARLQGEMRTAILLITHDLGTVADIADEVAVLYAGRCVEFGAAAAVLRRPLHPYAIGLLSCTPQLRLGPATPVGSVQVAGIQAGDLPEIAGTVPPLGQRPAICAFTPRCPRADVMCRNRLQPALAGTEGEAEDHTVACWHPGGHEA